MKFLKFRSLVTLISIVLIGGCASNTGDPTQTASVSRATEQQNNQNNLPVWKVSAAEQQILLNVWTPESKVIVNSSRMPGSQNAMLSLATVWVLGDKIGGQNCAGAIELLGIERQPSIDMEINTAESGRVLIKSENPSEIWSVRRCGETRKLFISDAGEKYLVYLLIENK